MRNIWIALRQRGIARKLLLGFGAVIACFIVLIVLTFLLVRANSRVSVNLITHIMPSVSQLEALANVVSRSELLMKSWVFAEKQDNSPSKIAFRKLQQEEYPAVLQSLDSLSQWWSESERETLRAIDKAVRDTLAPMHKEVTGLLSSFEAYDDFMVMSIVEPMVEPGGEISVTTERIVMQIRQFIQEKHEKMQQVGESVKQQEMVVRSFLTFGSLLMIVVSVVIAYVIAKGLRRSLNFALTAVGEVSQGILDAGFRSERQQ